MVSAGTVWAQDNVGASDRFRKWWVTESFLEEVMFELSMERLTEVGKMKKKKGIPSRDQHM